MSSMRRTVTQYRTVDGVADPTPNVGKWRRSLRALDPDTRKKLSYSGDLFKSRDFSESDGNLGEEEFDRAAALEKEYIKSLQQHVYLLELENVHLRTQSSKAASLQSPMSADAERMLLELKSLEAKVEALQLENSRKENSMEQLQSRILHLTERLASHEDARLAERNSEKPKTDELQLERDALERRVAQLKARIAQLEADGRVDGELKTAENRVQSLRGQLETALDKLARADAAIRSEREAVTRLDGEVRRMEQELEAGGHAAASTVRRLREENQRLRRLLEAAARPEDLAALARRNAILEATSQRLQAELARSQSGIRRELVGEEAVRIRERERQLKEQAARNAHEASELRRRLVQLEGDVGAGGVTDLVRQCQQLQRDNSQLAKHVRDLEAALDRTQAEKASARAAVDGSEARLSELQMELNKLQQHQATRWSEVEKIAATIKTAAKSNSELFDRS